MVPLFLNLTTRNRKIRKNGQSNINDVIIIVITVIISQEKGGFMSLVVAYKRDGIVYMGADTQTSLGSRIDRILNESGFKITKFPNGVLVGVCGRVKGHQLIKAQEKWFNLAENVTIDKRYIVKNIIPELSVLMKDINDDKEARSSSMSVLILIAHYDKIFVITKYFEVFECDSYAAIGAGDDFAKYTLSQISATSDVNEGLLEALRAGAHFESTVSAPYVLINTKDQQYTIVEG